MNRSILISGLILILMEFSCTAPMKKEIPQAPAAEVTIRNGVVTYIAGDIQVQNGTAWEPLDVGDTVAENAQIKTGKKSSCDIQFGQLGVVHLSEATTASLKTIGISSKHKAVDVELLIGSVTAKVSKLVGSDRFQVRTETVVCGVRGTRFAVTTGGTGESTKVAVAEGRVALIPPTYDAKKFDNLTTTNEGDNLVQAVEAKILELSSSVEVGSEVVVTKASLTKPAEAIARIQEAVVALSENQKVLSTAPASPGLLPEEVTKALQTYQNAVPPQEAPVNHPLGEDSKKVLEETVNLNVIEAPPTKKEESAAPPPAPATSVSQVPATPPAQAPAPSLAAPRLTTPAAGSSVDINQQQTIRFSWKVVPSATDYEVSLFKGQEKTPIKTWTTQDASVVLDKFTSLQVGSLRWEVVAVKSGASPLKSVPAVSTFLITKGGQLAAPSLDFSSQGSN